MLGGRLSSLRLGRAVFSARHIVLCFLPGSGLARYRTMSTRTICMDPFAYRQFEEGFRGTRVIGCDRDTFTARVNEHYEREKELVEGYAPFCKHIFMPNFTETVVGELEITEENVHLLKSDYCARRESELPVLERWFPRSAFPELPKAKVLDIILYSREQVIKENEAMGETCDMTEDWAIVSIKAQELEQESPMAPITMLRNALGKEYGGSGVPLEEEKYRASVAHWRKYAVVK